MMSSFFQKKFEFSQVNELIGSRIFSTIGFGIASVCIPIFLKSFNLTTSEIGFISSLIVGIALIFSIFSTIIIEKFNMFILFKISLFVFTISFFGLSFTKYLPICIMILVFINLFDRIKTNSFSIIFRDSLRKRDITKMEYTLYSMQNIGWFLGPILGGLILENYGFNYAFLTVSFFFLISFIVTNLTKLKTKHKKREKIDLNIFSNLKFFVKKKKFLLSYLMTFGVGFWYSLIFIFMPLFMIDAGLSNLMVGLFISGVCLPLIIVQYKINWFIKKFGFKKCVQIPYFLLVLICVSIFFIQNIYGTIFLLILSAFSLAFLEPAGDIYLFKNAKILEEEKIFPIYRTSRGIGDISGKVILGSLLLFFPNFYLFLFMGICMGIVGLTCNKLKNFKN
jgi:MFS family permease